MTNVDRDPRCIVGWDVVYERDYETLQVMLDGSPQAKQYYSDAFSVYEPWSTSPVTGGRLTTKAKPIR